MRIFLTGSTGYVGSAVARAFVAAGHQVTGLLRSGRGAGALAALGITSVEGDLTRPESLRRQLAGHDVVVHIAFDYSVSLAEGVRRDLIVADEMLDAAEKARHPQHVVYTASCYVAGGTAERPLTETSAVAPGAAGAERQPVEKEVVTAGGAVVRPGMVYGLAGGAVSELFVLGRTAGFVPYAGDGENHWAMVHVTDLAALYLRVAEQRLAGPFNAIDGVPITNRRVAELIAAATGAQAVSELQPAARIRWGDFAATLMRDVFADAPRSREKGWAPRVRSFEGAVATGEAFTRG
ncbi:MAG TPA: NAD-dependent epimerase/dehydratase family protein [Thermoanaerobaculia bacterium]|jgi:nucleoside-diphosphate-sugar epimerase|nr:NAD-dependent epimerase/dehydratase family protein [Thermoanaerobaculia bacterium]